MLDTSVSAVELVQHAVHERIKQQLITLSQKSYADIMDMIVEEVDAYSAAVAKNPSYGPLISRPERVAEQVYENIAGYGPIAQFMRRDDVEDILINNHLQAFAMIAGGRKEEIPLGFRLPSDLAAFADRLIAMDTTAPHALDLNTPIVDCMLPDGSRLHVDGPPLTRDAPMIQIRKISSAAPSTVQDSVRTGTMTAQAAEFLDRAWYGGCSMFIVGEVGSGKTTLLRALISGSSQPSDRIRVVEEHFELDPQMALHRDITCMQCRQSADPALRVELFDLIRASLRGLPSRLIPGEIRGKEAWDVSQALSAGIMCASTIHGDSCFDGLSKFARLMMLAEGMTHEIASGVIASTIDLVVHIAKKRVTDPNTGQVKIARRVTDISAVHPQAVGGAGFTLVPLFRYSPLYDRLGLVPGAHVRRPHKFEEAGINVHDQYLAYDWEGDLTGRGI